MSAYRRIENEALAGFDRAPERVGVAPVGHAFADRALPVPDVAGRDDEAALLGHERVEVRPVERDSGAEREL